MNEFMVRLQSHVAYDKDRHALIVPCSDVDDTPLRRVLEGYDLHSVEAVMTAFHRILRESVILSAVIAD